MRKKKLIKGLKRGLSLALVSAMVCATGCSKETSTVDIYDYEKESESLTHFSSSDSELDFFLNDYFKRHVGYVDEEEGDMRVTSIKPGAGFDAIFNHEWNTVALTWFDCFDSLDSDRLTSLKNSLVSVPVDRYGYVWDGTDSTKGTEVSLANTGAHSMGWPFPKAVDSEGWSTYWEFNGDKGSYEGEKWTTNFGAKTGHGLLRGTVQNDKKSLEFVSPALTGINTIMSYHAPYLEIDLRMYSENYKDIDDIYVWYKNDAKEKWSTKKCVSVKEIAAVHYDFASNYEHVLYLPMYAEKYWNSDANVEIAQIKIEIRAKEGKTLSGDFGLNYVRPSYDTRFSNNNSIYISTLNQYYNYTGDKEFLKQGIVDARKAMNFYMQMYDEERHLNRQSYMIGHEGNKEGATKAEQMSTSLSNGYWDVLYMAEYDFQSNMYFYKALVDLIELEETLEKEGIEVDKSQSDVLVANRDCTKKVSKYDLTIDDLKKIAADVLSALQKSTDDATATGFYDEKTGRFICGYNPQGEKMDFGYVMWNMKAVYYGIANEEQKKSIMDWISGERIVESDKEGEGSYGDDIYYYEFAPRITTVNDGHLFTGYYENVIGTDLPFGVKQIQYGGAAIFLSYYDLMDRIEIYGADNAFDRLKEIQKWYDKVYDYYKNENADPSPFDFYWDYYKQKVGITPQSGVHDGGGSGIVGLDGEFLESLLTVAAVPYGFFGLDTIDGNTLKVAPTLPEELDYWKIENMAFHKVKYDLSVYENAVRIDSVRGNAEDLSIQVEIPTNKRFYTVYVNGKETTDYTKQDGRVVVTLPFASAIVEIK